MKFNSPKEMATWLIDNEGDVLRDMYGRRWLYLDFVFYYADIGSEYQKERISCLHLFSTEFKTT